MSRIFICAHVGYHSLWNNIEEDIKKVFEFERSNPDYKVLVFITYQYFSVTIKEIKDKYKDFYYIKVPKKGQDIGGLILSLNIILKNFQITESDLLIVLHTKSFMHHTNMLRRALFDNFSESVNIFKADKDVGLLGSSRLILNLDNYNIPKIANICKRLSINYSFKLDKFVAGTIFMIRLSIIDKIFKRVPIMEFYNDLEDRYYTFNNTSTWIHSWERMFGIITRNLGYKIVGK